MSIRYVQSNYGKLDCENILRFILDLSIVELENVKPYEQGKIYTKGEFIYLKENGLHKIYRCKVDISSDTFISDEWEYIMDTYDEEIKNVCNFIIREEVYVVTDKEDINIVVPNYKPGNSMITIYNGKEIYNQGIDFDIVENGKINFNPSVEIENGDRLIIEIKETKGKPDRLILLNDNGFNYEIGVIGEDVYVIETDLRHSKPEVFIKDISTGENYRLFMLDEDIYYELTEIHTIQTEIKVIDTDENEYKLEMIDGTLFFSIKDSSSGDIEEPNEPEEPPEEDDNIAIVDEAIVDESKIQ